MKLFFLNPLVFVGLWIWLGHDLRWFQDSFNFKNSIQPNTAQVFDRHGYPLSFHYQDEWNTEQRVQLHEVPEDLVEILLFFEDRNFFQHAGVDWSARFAAIIQNIKAREVVRGASSITEQVIRMLHPRPRNLRTKVLETIEAYRLETLVSKNDILEFYLNQVPYARNRRGILQASREFFGRQLASLNIREKLALAIMIRAPSYYDYKKKPHRIMERVDSLAPELCRETGLACELEEARYDFHFTSWMPVEAEHFVRYVRSLQPSNDSRIETTLDIETQNAASDFLKARIYEMGITAPDQAAIILANHQSNEILAWYSMGSKIDPLLVARQPASSLKPFLYRLALERGLNLSTTILDVELRRPVGRGLHEFKNYSSTFYGPVSLRQALGNSLNTPAIRTLEFVGVTDFFLELRNLGIKSLTRDPDFYGLSLALGAGEITALELLEAYAILARRGLKVPLDALKTANQIESVRVFGQETADLIIDVLTDPWARNLEFGSESVLRFPHETAVKTGTSTNYRDAWAVGFNSQFVGLVWMGNLNQKPMLEVTGSKGPAPVLRRLFHYLNRRHPSPSFRKSKHLVAKKTEDSQGRIYTEYYIQDKERVLHLAEQEGLHLQEFLESPVDRLLIARDPRIPDEYEKISFKIKPEIKSEKIEWQLNREPLTPVDSNQRQVSWLIQEGRHELLVKLWQGSSAMPREQKITFEVRP